jgi:hypothetical protein
MSGKTWKTLYISTTSVGKLSIVVTPHNGFLPVAGAKDRGGQGFAIRRKRQENPTRNTMSTKNFPENILASQEIQSTRSKIKAASLLSPDQVTS